MFWWILAGICVFVGVLGVVLVLCNFDIGWILGAFVGLPGLLILCCIIPIHFENAKEVETFKQQKTYFEQVVPTFADGENYALTQKKIELNEWLYKTQHSKKTLGIFSLYSEEVLELEVIK